MMGPHDGPAARCLPDVNDTPASAAAHASAQTPRWRSLLAAALPGRASSTHAASCAVPLLASIPLSKDDVLFRGCKLKNSKYILGVALYTGHDTRIMKNARRAPFKVRRCACGLRFRHTRAL
jgi:magnesium-transporting ATPase (P-type)